MAYLIGVILFALGILISVSLHEAGHMGTAKLFGMRVTRFFVGFGPTLWSFRRGETEYGIKGIPLGGFVKITGMTEQEEADEDLSDADKKRVFWRKPLWQRTVVLAAGSAVHFILGFLILWILVSFVAAPNPAYAQEQSQSTQVTVLECLDPSGECGPDSDPSPAVVAGLKTGDAILAVNGVEVAGRECLVDNSAATRQEPTAWACVVNEIRALPADKPADFLISRDGADTAVELTPRTVTLTGSDGEVIEVAQVGIGQYVDPSISPSITHGPVGGVGAAADLTGQMAGLMGEAILRIPEKVPALWNSIWGDERDQETPVSVVGASRLGGEMVENEAWVAFFMLLATLNYFVGVFNLLPLLPMDGGHIAIAWFERVRSWLAAKRSKPDPGRVDYVKLLPLTYTVLVVMVGFTLLTITADIVNPITLFK
ncbi:RIP metalloprotease RseP [Stackebrandtia endophytica]|uniref:RIP metalloprotease RseP n=1 Tax=Stackebrandtia endophytica TaxID=1496996 RepID=A0A543B1M3_9ACTN|nr:site-2 protease family protein [Stackebrandtia endophytica]TQL78729.1 RIP metalloprotease RseP [Stackebrandtia endophytica]